MEKTSSIQPSVATTRAGSIIHANRIARRSKKEIAFSSMRSLRSARVKNYFTTMAWKSTSHERARLKKSMLASAAPRPAAEHCSTPKNLVELLHEQPNESRKNACESGKHDRNTARPSFLESRSRHVVMNVRALVDLHQEKSDHEADEAPLQAAEDQFPHSILL